MLLGADFERVTVQGHTKVRTVTTWKSPDQIRCRVKLIRQNVGFQAGAPDPGKAKIFETLSVQIFLDHHVFGLQARAPLKPSK